MEAEEMVQESFLRWQNATTERIKQPKAYLCSITTRLCIDYLRSARVKREEYIGQWLPEPLMSNKMPDVGERVALLDSISMAFLMLLETLTPVERAVFLLHDVFDYEYATVAGVVGKSESNCRQIAHRARKRIVADRPRFKPSAERQQQLAQQFIQTCANGDMSSLLQLLADDVVLYSDGGGKRAAARKPIHGATRVARFLLGVSRKAPPNMSIQPTAINGQPGLIVYLEGEPYVTFTFHIANEQIQTIYGVLNPDKLQHVPPYDLVNGEW